MKGQTSCCVPYGVKKMESFKLTFSSNVSSLKIRVLVIYNHYLFV